MKKKGYILTDWFFFFGDKDKKNLDSILQNDKNKGLLEEFITWKLITVYLPLITFLLVVILNLLTNTFDANCFYSYMNNGSLPIISFGIITSGMPYLLEQLKDFPDYQSARRRVMAISLFFLFLSASLYVIQTFSIISPLLNNLTKLLILIFSIYVFLFSSSIGYKMFLLQSKNITTYEEDVKDKVKDLKDSVEDLD